MQFIYKEHDDHSRKGRQIVDSFIEKCWQEEIGRYINLDYSELRRNKDFKDLLLREQKGFCCYCMRRIPEKQASLEHVMPRNIGKGEDNLLFHYHRYISPHSVVHCPAIEQNAKIHYPPYPHSIAYENITVSCDGRIFENGNDYILHACCNNRRGNDRIIPLFFLPRIHSILKYEEDGRLVYADEYEATIKSLNLDCDSLRLIRKVWARIRRCNIRIGEVKDGENNEEIRKNILVKLDIERREEQKMQNEKYWFLLIQFDWFYHYFNLTKPTPIQTI